MIVELLLVGGPDDDGTDEAADELRREIHEGRRDADVDALRVLIGPRGEDAQSDGRVEVRARLVRGEDTGEDGEAPPDVDHERPSPEASVAGQQHVGHHSDTQDDENRRPEKFADEDLTEAHGCLSRRSTVACDGRHSCCR